MGVLKFIGGYVAGSVIIGGTVYTAVALAADSKGRKEAKAEAAKK